MGSSRSGVGLLNTVGEMSRPLTPIWWECGEELFLCTTRFRTKGLRQNIGMDLAARRLFSGRFWTGWAGYDSFAR